MLIKKPFKKGIGAGQAAFYKAAGGGSLGLQTSLGAFWSLENTSWLDDTVGATTLTGIASPTAAAAKVGNGASLNGSTQYLTAASNTNIANGGGSFSVQAWANSGTAGDGFITNKSAGSFGDRDWMLGSTFTSGNFYCFSVFNTSQTQFDAVSAVAVASGWHHFVATYNSATKAIIIYVDGAASGPGATLTGTANSSAAAPIYIGTSEAAGTPRLNGTVDQVGFWKGRILSAGDVTALYNGGTGLTYAGMV